MKAQTKFLTWLVLALFLQSFNSYAQSPGWAWAEMIDGTGRDNGYSIAVDDVDNIYISGRFDGTADLDPGPGVFNLTSVGLDNFFVCKLTSSGNLIWVKTTLNFFRSNVAVDAACNVFITGQFYGSQDFDPGPGTAILNSGGQVGTYICKLDSSGTFLWVKGLTGSSEVNALAMDIDHSGNIYTTGYFLGTIDFDPGPAGYALTSPNRSIFVSKLDSSGSFVYAKAFDGAGLNTGKGIAVDINGEVAITGAFFGTVDFDPGIATMNLVSSGSADAYILNLNAAGNLKWALRIGSTGNEQGAGIKIGAAGDRYIVGYYRDTVDFDPGAGVHTVNSATDGSDFILKLDSTGNFTWVHTLGVLPAAFSSVAIALDSSDNIYSTGTIYGTVDMDPGVGVSYFTSAGVHDMQVSKFDSSGAFLWGATAGGTDLDMATDIAVDQSGSPVITGSSYSPALIFGADTLWNTGTLEVMPVAKLHPVPVGITQRTPPIQTQVYPNPSNEKVTIVCRDMEQVDIYDALGNLVVSHPLHSNAQNETAIDVSGLKSGIYYLKIVSREGEVVSRLVKISE